MPSSSLFNVTQRLVRQAAESNMVTLEEMQRFSAQVSLWAEQVLVFI